MGIHHIGGEASRGLRHPHGHSNEQYKRRGDRELESGRTIPAHCASYYPSAGNRDRGHYLLSVSRRFR